MPLQKCVFVLASLVLQHCAAGNTTANQQLVYTNVGAFQGFESAAGVRTWLGIPFGQSTNGSRRFRPPQRADVVPIDQIFNATQFGLGCSQNKGLEYRYQLSVGGINSIGNFSTGDDCLNLNIWSSNANRSNVNGNAVLVWIYGGSSQFGGSAVPFYDGENLVRNEPNLTVVSINYRLSMWGQPIGAVPPVPKHEANLGLLDQRMAVEWVYNNIRAFGGDPERIVLFGESAGAGAVALWPYNYQWDPIVKGIILESGTETVFSSTGGANVTQAALAWQDIAAAVNCSSNSTFTSNNDSQFQCLQDTPSAILEKAVSNTSLASSFSAIVDNTTLYSASEYTRRRQTGDFAAIPVFVGYNKDEGATFASSLGLPADLITLFGFACPATSVAQSRLNASVPSYVYEYEGFFPNINSIPALGTYHSSEIPMVFGTYNKSTIAPVTNFQVHTSRVMQGAWAAFAQDPAEGLLRYGLKRYALNGTSLNVFGVNNSAPLTHAAISANATTCKLLFPEIA